MPNPTDIGGCSSAAVDNAHVHHVGNLVGTSCGSSFTLITRQRCVVQQLRSPAHPSRVSIRADLHLVAKAGGVLCSAKIQ